MICFQPVTLKNACFCVCVCVSSVFIDIADELLGSDWTCLMSCWCESQQMKMRFCIRTTAKTPDRWRQMGGVQHRTHTHTQPCFHVTYLSPCCLLKTGNTCVCAILTHTHHGELDGETAMCRSLDGHVDGQSDGQFKDG